jgi:hypothetical protein
MPIINKNDNLSRDITLDLLDSHHLKSSFDDEYKYEVFCVWYMNGKPKGQKLQSLIEPNLDGVIPAASTLNTWMKDLQPLADELDQKIKAQVEETIVLEKVEMLKRHADLGRAMQDLAVDFLENNRDQLTPNSAVRLLVEAVKMERESRGLPTLITQTIDSTDEELMKQINDLMNKVGENIDLDDETVSNL